MPRTAFVILTVALIIVKVESILTECAPEADVNAALAAAEIRAAGYLGDAEANELVDELKRSGTKRSDGTICFTDADFERFGSLVSAFFKEHESEETVRQQNFNFEGQKQSNPTGGRRCYCGRCAVGHESYCTRNSVAVCCPHYCANIFSAVALAALSGVEGSGLDTCCEEGKKACPKPQVPGQRTGTSPKKSKKGSTPPPELDFGIDGSNAGLMGGLVGSLLEGQTVTPTPSVSPSPTLAQVNDTSNSEIPDWTSSPSPSPQVVVTPPTESSMPSADANSLESPRMIESRNPMPSVSGPVLLPKDDEFEGTGTEPFYEETLPDLVSGEKDEEIGASPEDLLAGS